MPIVTPDGWNLSLDTDGTVLISRFFEFDGRECLALGYLKETDGRYVPTVRIRTHTGPWFISKSISYDLTIGKPIRHRTHSVLSDAVKALDMETLFYNTRKMLRMHESLTALGFVLDGLEQYEIPDGMDVNDLASLTNVERS